MVAPTRQERSMAAPLSRLQRSSSKVVRLSMMATLLLALVGGFLTISLLRSNKDTTAMKQPSIKQKDTLVLSTIHGKIKMKLRSDLSQSSVDYIRELVNTGEKCNACNFYRAEKDFLLQGIMKNSNAKTKISKGKCPIGYPPKSDDCPPEKFDCGCHGPTMRNGLVGWAAGQTGPDFFITSSSTPVEAWGQTHTVFAEISDEPSFRVIDKIYTLPTTQKGLTMLVDKIHFVPSLE